MNNNHEVNAEDLYNLVLDSINYSERGLLDITVVKNEEGDSILVKQFIPKLHFECTYNIVRKNNEISYQLRNRDTIFVKGIVYIFSCSSTTANGIPHLDVMEAFRNIAMFTKKGDFVINNNGGLLNGMWGAKEPYRINIRIVDGSIKKLSRMNGEEFPAGSIYTNLREYAVSGYTPVPIDEGEMRTRVISTGIVSRLNLNDYLSEKNKL